MKVKKRRIYNCCQIRIYEKPYYEKTSVLVVLSSPIYNPDNAPPVIAIKGKHYLYGGYFKELSEERATIRYNLIKPRKGTVAHRQVAIK